jgi:hypothetical protein
LDGYSKSSQESGRKTFTVRSAGSSRCGEVPEQVIHVVEVVVNDRADLARLPD